MTVRELYIGDGVYARFDGFALTLWTTRAEGTHWLALEPEHWANLLAFMAQFTPAEEQPE